MTHLFVYGSLIFPDVWQPLVSRHYLSDPAFLPRYQRSKIFFDTYPLAYPQTHATGFLGLVYFDLGAQDLARLDTFEGAIYQRRPCEVLTATGPVAAQIYCPKAEFEHLICATPWTPALFNTCLKAGFLQRYCARH